MKDRSQINSPGSVRSPPPKTGFEAARCGRALSSIPAAVRAHRAEDHGVRKKNIYVCYNSALERNFI